MKISRRGKHTKRARRGRHTKHAGKKLRYKSKKFRASKRYHRGNKRTYKRGRRFHRGGAKTVTLNDVKFDIIMLETNYYIFFLNCLIYKIIILCIDISKFN